MTSRFLAALLAASVVAVSAAACDDGRVDGYYDHGGDPCNRYTSCGACTPVLGCGWCATGVGQGLCASDPDECSNASSFSWTWDSSGCFAPADGGVVTTSDGGSTSVDAGTQATDAGSSPVDAARSSSDDAGAVGTTDGDVPDTGTIN